MLQISTGRFARDVELNETLHRAVLYTNLQFRPMPARRMLGIWGH